MLKMRYTTKINNINHPKKNYKQWKKILINL